MNWEAVAAMLKKQQTEAEKVSREYLTVRDKELSIAFGVTAAILGSIGEALAEGLNFTF